MSRYLEGGDHTRSSASKSLLETTRHNSRDIPRSMKYADYLGDIVNNVDNPVGLDKTASNLDASEPRQFALKRSHVGKL